MGAARRQHLPPAPSRFLSFSSVSSRTPRPPVKTMRCPDVAPMQPIIPSTAGMTVASVWLSLGLPGQGGDMGHELAAQEMKTTTQQDSCTAPADLARNHHASQLVVDGSECQSETSWLGIISSFLPDRLFKDVCQPMYAAEPGFPPDAKVTSSCCSICAALRFGRLGEFLNARFMNGAVRNLWELPDDRVDRNPSYVKLLNDLSNTRGIVFRRTKLISTSKIVSRWCVQVTQARWTFPTGMAELSARRTIIMSPTWLCVSPSIVASSSSCLARYHVEGRNGGGSFSALGGLCARTRASQGAS